MKSLIFKLFFSFLIPIIGFSQNHNLVDIEGNVYKTVKIGNQVWMAENLKTTRYQDGSPIKYQEPWNDGNYRGEPRYIELKDGTILYNYYTASNTKNLAPKGWRIPTEKDIKDLMYHLLPGYDDNISSISEIGIKEKIIAKSLKSKTGWKKVESGGMIPYPCPNCKKWPKFKKKNDYCSVCENVRWLANRIPITWSDNNGDNTVNFNAKQIYSIQSSYYYGDLELSEWPAFWTSTSPGKDSYQKVDERYAIVYKFAGDSFYEGRSMKKKSLLQIRCIKNSIEEKETIKPNFTKETIKPINSKNEEKKFKNLPYIKNTCSDFPFKLGCVSDKIREIQICLNPVAVLKEDGRFGPVMLKSMRDQSLFAGSSDDMTITKEIYDMIMKRCK